MGKITPFKRIDVAIEITRQAGRRLILAAKIDPADVDYYNSEIKELIETSDHVDFIGEVSESDKPALLAGAAGVLLPFLWLEPFGLIVIEALAAGTPVIVPHIGAFPEIVGFDGEVGVVCGETRLTREVIKGSEEEKAFIKQAVEAIDCLEGITSTACRERASWFTPERMAESYVNLYREAMCKHPSFEAGSVLSSSCVTTPKINSLGL